MNPIHPAARLARDKYGQSAAFFEDLGLQTPVPEPVNAFAEATAAEASAVNDRSKHALEGAAEAVERSFDVASQGAFILRRKLIHITQRNVSSGFEFIRRLAGAENLIEIATLQMSYWREQFAALAAQAEEVRELSTALAASAAESIKAHVTRSMPRAIWE